MNPLQNQQHAFTVDYSTPKEVKEKILKSEIDKLPLTEQCLIIANRELMDPKSDVRSKDLQMMEMHKGELQERINYLQNRENRVVKLIINCFKNLFSLKKSPSKLEMAQAEFDAVKDAKTFLLEKKIMYLSKLSEELTNTMKNLTGIDLKLGEGETTEEVADQWITALMGTVPNKEENQEKILPLIFKGKIIDVKPQDMEAILKLGNYFKGDEGIKWRDAFIDNIASKDAALKGNAHISKLLLGEMKEVYNDKKDIAFYLMSEVCHIGGSIRRINMEKLFMLLDHKEIKNFEPMKKAVLEEAKNIQLRAIHREQSDIVWAQKMEKTQKQKWDREEVDYKNHLGIEGIYSIAKKSGVELPENIQPTPLLNKLMGDLQSINKQLANESE